MELTFLEKLIDGFDLVTFRFFFLYKDFGRTSSFNKDFQIQYLYSFLFSCHHWHIYSALWEALMENTKSRAI